MKGDPHAVVYEGDDIYIEELPNGCFITRIGEPNQNVHIASLQDALAVIESLQKMIKIQYGDEDGID